MTLPATAHAARLSSGETLAQASQERLLVLVFLRHFGCTFTRQILKGLENLQRQAKQHDARLILVHMLRRGEELHYLTGHDDVQRIADPKCELYKAFGLGHGTFRALFGLHVWWRAALSMASGCGVGHLAGDGMQMPGAFLVWNGEIIAAQKARSASDLPDLDGLFSTLKGAADESEQRI